MFKESRKSILGDGNSGDDDDDDDINDENYISKFIHFVDKLITSNSDDIWEMDESVGVRYARGSSAVAISRLNLPLPQMPNKIWLEVLQREFLYYKASSISTARDETMFGLTQTLKLVKEQLIAAQSTVDKNLC